MVPGGVEVIAGVTHDPTFGPLVLYGSGGTLVELLADVAFRLHPLTDVDVAAMLDEVARAPRCCAATGGAPPADEAALKDLLLRGLRARRRLPGVREMDLNPVNVFRRAPRRGRAVRVGERISAPREESPTDGSASPRPRCRARLRDDARHVPTKARASPVCCRVSIRSRAGGCRASCGPRTSGGSRPRCPKACGDPDSPSLLQRIDEAPILGGQPRASLLPRRGGFAAMCRGISTRRGRKSCSSPTS